MKNASKMRSVCYKKTAEYIFDTIEKIRIGWKINTYTHTHTSLAVVSL